MKILNVMIAALAASTGLNALACQGIDDHLPHATKLERIDATTVRVHRPYHVMRYGGGAGAEVYYSTLASKNKICRNLVLDVHYTGIEEGTVTRMNGDYVRGTAQATEEKLPGRISAAAFSIREFRGSVEDYRDYQETAPYRIHAIESIDCTVKEPVKETVRETQS